MGSKFDDGNGFFSKVVLGDRLPSVQVSFISNWSFTTMSIGYLRVKEFNPGSFISFRIQMFCLHALMQGKKSPQKGWSRIALQMDMSDERCDTSVTLIRLTVLICHLL